jgi:zeaxanthin glucosyltransferase
MPVSHFAVIAPPFTSHVRALEALAGELLARGHRVTWVQQDDVRGLLTDRRITFAAVGAASHPAGSLARVVARAAKPGLWGIRRVIDDMAAATGMLCREAPAVLREARVDAVLADEMEAAGGLVAQAAGLPFVSVAAALPVQREPHLPLPVMPWGCAQDQAGERLNLHSERVYDWLMRPHGRVIAGQAHRFGLPPRTALHDCLSPLLRIAQVTASFDFPRRDASLLHGVGPLRPRGQHAAQGRWPAGFDPKPGVPLVFASLGTLQGGRFGLFRRIAQACDAEGVQLLLAHCGGLGPDQERQLARDGATWVTDFAPQQAAVERADVVVTHAGLNTAMDALAAGTPMLALPIAFDQPGVAARIVHAGAGVRLLPALATRRALRRGLRSLLDDDTYARRARELGADVRAAGGVVRAADLIENSLGGAAPAAREAGPAARASRHVADPVEQD